MEDYTEHPELFEREWQTVEQFLAEQHDGKTPTYGETCVEILDNYIHGKRIVPEESCT